MDAISSPQLFDRPTFCTLILEHYSQAVDAEARANELRGLEGEAAEVQRHLAEHRNRIGVLKQETEAQLASAGLLADAAARKEAELQAVRLVVVLHELWIVL